MALVCRILHLSDLHYGRLNKNICHRFEPTEEPDITQFVHKCADAIVKHLKETNETFAIPLFIVITGDFVCKGSNEKEHKTAFLNIQKLKQLLSTNFVDIDIFLVPGNHDVDRDSEGIDPLKNHILHVHNPLVSGKPERELPLHFGKNNKYTKESKDLKWVQQINIKDDLTIAFLPLYSPVTDKRLLTNPYPIKEKLTLTDPWVFDRGLITGDQWHSVIEELQSFEDDSNKCLKIAFCHHNPLPLRRRFRDPYNDIYKPIDHFTRPEVNLLANGSELLPFLADQGVGLLLHGHRHQDAIATSFPRRRLIIIGAASAGISNSELIDKNDGKSEKIGLLVSIGNLIKQYKKLKEPVLLSEKGDNIPDKWQGFNLINIFQTELGYSIIANSFTYVANDGIFMVDESNRKDSLHEIKPIPLYNNPNYPFKPLSESEGVKSVTKHLTQSEHGTTSLHYTYWADWDDDSDDAKLLRTNFDVCPAGINTPFYKLWEHVINDPETLKGFAHYLAVNPRQVTQERIDKLKLWVTLSLDEGYIVTELKNAIRGRCDESNIPWKEVTDHKINKHDNGFFNSLFKLGRETNRWVNYALELLKLAEDADYNLTRCVYFWPPLEDRHKGADKENLKEFTSRKIIWLLHSLLAYRGLENVNISWLPLAIGGCDGQTFLCMEPPADRRSSNPNVLVGFGADLDGKREDRISVFKMTSITEGVVVGGDLGENLRGMLSHVVQPLARRLVATFPLMIKGKVCCNNIKKIIAIFELEKELHTPFEAFISNVDKYDQAYKDKSEDVASALAFQVGNDGELTINPKKWQLRLEELYNWKNFNHHQVDERTYAQDKRLPWNKKDYDWLKMRLQLIGE